MAPTPPASRHWQTLRVKMLERLGLDKDLIYPEGAEKKKK